MNNQGLRHAVVVTSASVVVCLLVACGPAPDGGGANNGGPCSTGSTWTGGDEESPKMHPGGDCVSCHADGEGPNYALAGTVMADLADATDCNGVAGVTVEILDKDGIVFDSLVTNSAGNFYRRSELPASALPYTVRLTRDGQTSEMATAQTEQNCMACHTADGAQGAPGRIVAP